MLMDYKITVVQETKTSTFDGRIKSLNELPEKLRQAEQQMIKGQKAVITISYAPVSEEQLEYERAKRRAIVKEVFDEVMNEVKENE